MKPLLEATALKLTGGANEIEPLLAMFKDDSERSLPSNV